MIVEGRINNATESLDIKKIKEKKENEDKSKWIT